MLIKSHFKLFQKRTLLFLFLSITTVYLCYSQENPTTNNIEQHYQDVFDSVMASDKFVEKLDSASFFNLPVGILGGDNADPDYAILINEVSLYPDKATFNASMVLTNPFDGNKLIFVANKVPFTFSGGIQGTFRLELMNEKPVSVCKDIDLEILAGSFVEFDCNGFKSLNLKGRVALSEKTFVPADLNGNTIEGKVSAFFETTLADWNDMVFSIGLSPFQIKGYPDFTFQCSNLSVDFSDLQNPSTLVFPESYNSIYPASVIEMWRGVFIEEASIILNPNKFKSKNSNQPFIVGSKNLIIDEQGFSGIAYAQNLFTLEEGDMSGWSFSVEELKLQFDQNDLVAGGLAGSVQIPTFEENTSFAYDAFVDVAGDYTFKISPESSVNMNLFGQTSLELYQSSFVKVESIENTFTPTASLNGKLSVAPSISGDANSNKDKLSLADLEFQEFNISSKEPYIDIKYMAYHGSGQTKLAKFPVTINEIIFSSTDQTAKLSIGANVNLKKSSDEGFGGSTRISLLADRENYQYKFKGVQLDKLTVHAEKSGAYKIHGSVEFARGDPVYGNGFRGELDVAFSENIEIKALALFGNVDGMRYFFVDGMFAMKPGIQAGPITIFGFGGGLYHHMKQQPGLIDKNSFGASRSGIVYQPDPNLALGIRASVKLGLVSETVINAEATFEIAFTNSGGISSIGFEGAAECITPPIAINTDLFSKQTSEMVDNGGETVSNSSSAAISARMSMLQDFENREFHAEMEIFVNVAGAIKGVGAGNRAGWSVVHVADDEWYLHIGSPSDPIGIEVVGLVKLQSYFMAGHRLPTTMPINPKVAEILKISPEEISGNRNTSSLESGKGVAFGASMEISTGDVTFLMFYGSFDLGLGFDILLADYGKSTYCAGSSPPLGINGWYAKGQSYVYFAGKIGLKATVFKKEKKIDILSIAAAAYMRAEAPNPVWMVGYVGGEYSVLGGMLSGNCRFKVEVGERCDMVTASPLADLELIGDITPGKNEDDVDVFTTPQVVFNVPVEKTVKISNDDGSSSYFRVIFESLTLKNDDIACTYDAEWNHKKNVIQMVPTTILSPLSDYTLEVEITFEEKIDGEWVPFKHEGELLTEKRTVEFKTGELPDRIPATEIAYSYPVERQYNFMPEEYNSAYIIFKRDLQPFFSASEKYDRKARWKNIFESEKLTDITYKSGEKTLYMSLPDRMSLNRIYSFELVAVPKVSGSVDHNVSSSTSDVETGSDDATMAITTQEAEGTITTSEEKVMYNYSFKTSAYNSFNERFENKTILVRALHDRAYKSFCPIIDMPGGEPMDKFELAIGTDQPALIKLEADLDNTAWFNEEVFIKNYKNYPYYGNTSIIWRDVTIHGLTAKTAFNVWQYHVYPSLSDSEIEQGVVYNEVPFTDLEYTLPHYWSEDYFDIRDRLAYDTKHIEVTNPVIETILENMRMRSIKPGSYPVKISYILPGKNIVTSTAIITFKNEIKTDAADF